MTRGSGGGGGGVTPGASPMSSFVNALVRCHLSFIVDV